MIRVEDVSFRYGAKDAASPDSASPDAAADLALDGVSFTVPQGSLTVLCGASGCGKSTALRLLNGLVPYFHEGDLAGSVQVAGVQISGAAADSAATPANTQLALVSAGEVSATVFQNPRTQFFTSQVRSELAFRNENYGVDPEEIRERIRTQGPDLGVSDLLERSLRQLSGGELQRVACAQAVMSNTPVLLFDEPTSNLSVPAISQFRQQLERLKSQGKTLVIAEHRLAFLNGLADRVLVMEHGRIAHSFTGTEFYALTEQQRKDLGLRSLHLAEGVFSQPLTPAPSAPNNEPVANGISLRNLRAGYGKRTVLEVPRLDLPAGQVTAVVGHNGMGKSTLAKVLSGLLKPARGSQIYRDGQLRRAHDLRAETALVMQDVNRQLFSARVKDEVLLGLDARARAEIDVPGLLAEFDLERFADRHPLSLSGGQKQRLVIAAAVARRARLYLFDEPTSGVDYRHLQRIASRLRALAAEDANVLVITHDPELIAACADSLLVLRQRIGAEGVAVTDCAVSDCMP